MKNYYKLFNPVFEGEGEGESGAGEGGAGEGAGGSEVKNFTQEQVDKIISDRLKNQNKNLQTALEEIESLKAKSQLTAAERAELEGRVDNLNKTLMTKEQLAAKEKNKLEKQLTGEIENLKNDLDTWKKRYTESTIQRGILDAGVKHKAVNPSQLVAILSSSTRLIEELDGDKPTGRLIPKTTLMDTDEKGNPVQLELSPDEAVKRMTEMEDYLNLFVDNNPNGFGKRNNSKGTKADLASMASGDIDSYIKGREDGSIKL